MALQPGNDTPVACCPLVSYVAYASVTDDDRRQRPLLVWPPTLCRGQTGSDPMY